MTDFTQAHFAEPQWLWLAAAGPALLAGLLVHARRARRRQLSNLVAPQALPGLTRSHSPVRRSLKNVLLALALAGMGLALARPQWGVLELAAQPVGEDIVFAVDCSQSMLAADVSPNRLERAKLAVSDYARRHARGRLGLVVFSGQAFLQCPLTFDYDAFEESLLALDAKSIQVPGTDIGSALKEAAQAMKSNDGRKVIVLLTDGEDLEQSGVRTAEELAKHGVVVFTVGVGTEAGAEIRVLNDQGQAEFVRDSQGAEVRSRLDEATVRKIAAATQGSYFSLGTLGEGFARLQFALETDAQSHAPQRNIGVDRFHIPIAVVLGLIIVESLISTRRRAVELRNT